MESVRGAFQSDALVLAGLTLHSEGIARLVLIEQYGAGDMAVLLLAAYV